MNNKKKNPSEKKIPTGQYYLLVWRIQFTLLEKYILKVLEEKGPCSDEEIANSLSMTAAEVSFIIQDEGLAKNERVQGDQSRRTLKSNFTKKEYKKYKEYIEVEKNKDEKEYTKQCCNDFEEKHIEEFKCSQISYKNAPKYLQKLKADTYYTINRLPEDHVELNP